MYWLKTKIQKNFDIGGKRMVNFYLFLMKKILLYNPSFAISD